MSASKIPQKVIKSVFNESRRLRNPRLYDLRQLQAVARCLADGFKKKKKVLAFGNGGSAADAQHFVAEFIGRFYKLERKALPAIALTANSSIVTALSNDYGFPYVFARQIEAFGQRGDVAVGISTSGNAESIMRGFQEARKRGLQTVFLTGKTGGRITRELGKQIDYMIFVPSENTGRIQEVHIMIIHLLCALVEYELFGKKAAGNIS